MTERLLSISGEDSLSIGRKYTTAVQCKLDTRLMLLSNELPRFSDVSGALAGRMIILRLTRSWYGVEDAGLLERLLPELPGILLWAIEGWHRLRARGRFVVPASSREVQEELEDLTSPVGAFIRQCCEIGPELSVPRNALYTAYQGWCRSEGMMHVSQPRRLWTRPEDGRGYATRWAAPRRHPPLSRRQPAGVRRASQPQQVNDNNLLRNLLRGGATLLRAWLSRHWPRFSGAQPQHTQQGPQQVTQQVNTFTKPRNLRVRNTRNR